MYITVKTLEIAGFRSAVEALRLPFGKECRSHTGLGISFHEDSISYMATVQFHLNDLKLMQALIRRGDEHAKVIRGINVYAEINAPRYWWCEMDTYRIGTERLSSESTMHIQCQGLSTAELIERKEHLEEGTMQKRIQMFSYQTLRRIYHQRHDHRLPHWHEFCEWIEGLPFAKELILCEANNEPKK